MPIPEPIYVGGGGLKRPGAKIPKRHLKKPKDSILGITKPAIRRLARRGGVKRISSDIYEEVRFALRTRLTAILTRIIISKQAYSVDRNLDSDALARKTITTRDVIFALHRMGTPLYYGFDHPDAAGFDPWG